MAKSKRGELWAQGGLEDMSGKVELLIFPESFRKLGEKVKLEVPVLIRGGVRVEDGANAKLTVNEIIALDDAKVPLPKALRIRIPLESASEDTVGALHALFHDRPGEAKVLFDVERQGDFMVVMEAEGYNVMPDRNFIGRVEELCDAAACASSVDPRPLSGSALNREKITRAERSEDSAGTSRSRGNRVPAFDCRIASCPREWERR